jgi:hypothetical protein
LLKAGNDKKNEEGGKHSKKSSISNLKDKALDKEPQGDMEKVIELTEKATRKRLLSQTLALWKAKFALSTKNRKGGATLQEEKKREEAEKASENKLSTSLASNSLSY